MINPNLTEAKELVQEQNAQNERTQLQELQEQLAVLRKQNDQYRSRIQEQDKTMESLANAELAQGNNSGSLLDKELKELRSEVEELTHLEGKRKEAAELRRKVNSMRERDKVGNYKPPIHTIASLPADESKLKGLVYKHALKQLQENRPNVDPNSGRIKSKLDLYTNSMTKSILAQKDTRATDWVRKHNVQKFAPTAQSSATIALQIKPIVSMSELGLREIEL